MKRRPRTRPRATETAAADPAAPDAGPPAAAGVARAPWARRTRLTLAVVLTIAAVACHAIFLLHAGGLWRDEANTVAMATLPTLAEMWSLISRDNMGLLPLLVVRGWCALGLGDGDTGLRILGGLVGLGSIGAYWLASLTMRREPPVLALALVGLNVAMVRSVDALRSYGLGALLAVLAFVALWHLARRPGVRRTVVAALAGVLSVQALYGNAFLLLAAGLAAMLVCARRRDWRGVLLVTAAGIVAALSLLPYVPGVLEAQSWYELEKTGLSPAGLWAKAGEAAGWPHPAMRWVWAALIALAATGAVATFWLRRHAPAAPADEARADLVIYGGAAVVVGTAGYCAFLMYAGLPTQFWYYAPLLAFVAAGLEAAVESWHRVTRLAAAGVALAALAGAAWLGAAPLSLAQTNVDQLAAILERDAAPGDLILVHPWYCGVSFARYYRGPVTWETLPPLDDHRIHRYDHFKARMQETAPIDSVLARATATLTSGRRIWLVGQVPFPDRPPGRIPPAPHSPYGWNDEAYSQAWGAEFGHLLRLRATRSALVVDSRGQPVHPFENLPLIVFEGWRW